MRNKTLTEAATLKGRIRNSQTKLKILGNQNSNANDSQHRESDWASRLPPIRLCTKASSPLQPRWEGGSIGFTSTQIYHGRTAGRSVAPLLWGLREVLGWNLNAKSHLMLNLQPHLLRVNRDTKLGREVILPPTPGNWASIPSKSPVNSTLQEKAGRATVLRRRC